MSLATENILTTRGAEQKLLSALVALFSLKFAAIAALALSFLAVVLFVFYVIFAAIYQVCSQLAQLWAASSPIEKLLFLLLAWVFIAWATRLYRRFHHAA